MSTPRAASKGETTRQAIVARATELARTVGLEGITLGVLADSLELSKSGLFAHFRSKENLQVAIIEEARRQFVDGVVVPALKKPRGEPRVVALFDRWLAWSERSGGCFFVAAAAELDDREGVARDAATKAQRDWLDTLRHAAELAVAEGHFRKDLDARQFAFEVESLMLGCHFMLRFLRDPEAKDHGRKAFDGLLARSRA